MNQSIYAFSLIDSIWRELGSVPITTTKEFPHFSYNKVEYFLTEDNNLWSYSSISNSWILIGEVPIDIRKKGICEVIGNKVYVGIFERRNQIWEYDIINNLWKEKTLLVGDNNSINIGSFVNEDKIRIIRSDRSGPSSKMQILEFDPNSI